MPETRHLESSWTFERFVTMQTLDLDAGIRHDLFGIFIRDFNYIAIEGITEEGG